MDKYVRAITFLTVSILGISTLLLLASCGSSHDPSNHNLKNSVRIADTKYGNVYRIEDEEKGNLIYVVESGSTGNCGITVVPVPKK